jgi:MerR family transcriptional regulator, copper efflux regulator
VSALSAASPLSIGALARETGVSVRSIRHYDDHGLLQSSRASNGYRSFAPVAVTQVRQIQRFIATGLSLAEIQAFPDCMLLVEGALSCPETTPAQRKRLEAIDREIADLERRRTRLIQLLSDGAAPG